jgi:hypothetical protein
MVRVDDFAADVALPVENRDRSRSAAGLLGARADSSQLVNPPTAVCRRFFQRAVRYMDAYVPREAGPALSILQVANLVKKYKSHRRCPERWGLAAAQRWSTNP